MSENKPVKLDFFNLAPGPLVEIRDIKELCNCECCVSLRAACAKIPSKLEANVSETAKQQSPMKPEEMNQVMKDWHKAFLTQFEGVPVRVDPELEGGQYYIAISQETFHNLEDMKDGH